MQFWYQRFGWQAALLWPLSLLFRMVVYLRRLAYCLHFFNVYRAPVEVIVVGNITVGGVGKTPVVAALVTQLRTAGRKPGVISRGYGGQASMWPQVVTQNSDSVQVGDEPVMLVRQTGVPMVVGPNRQADIERLLAEFDCDVVVSDDGLQHYALARDKEIVVMDRLGNQLCLPAGPLREPVSRLKSVNQILIHGEDFTLVPGPLYRLDGQPGTLAPCRVHAVAGIGHPQRFFDTLTALEFEVIPHPKPDHHRFQPSDLSFADALPVVITEKDAVKCVLAEKVWVLPVKAHCVCDAFAVH